MIDKCKSNNIDAIALTVDTITGGNRERILGQVLHLTRLTLKVF